MHQAIGITFAQSAQREMGGLMGTHAQTRDGERYELLGELASGGMATVYLARMRRMMGFSRLVAIKCMHPQFAKDPSFVSMFMDEARLTARLRHPNIVPTLDIVAEDGHLLLVMEYVEGASLASLLRSAAKAGVRLPVPVACAIVHDMLLGLHEAHEAKDDDGAPLAIVHRDVSPQNVIVGFDGLSRVLDFGVARARQNTHHSNDNEIKGKIPYMPPEQLFGEALDHKVDVYAAGVTLWEALVCERLFDGPSETALVKKISEEPITRPSSRLSGLSPELDAIVMKALEREPQNRFQSALEMAEAIAKVVPLPTRTEVASFVRQLVASKEIGSGTKLPPLEDPTTRRTALIAILERASMLSPSAKRVAVEETAMMPPSSRSSLAPLTVSGLVGASAPVAIPARSTAITRLAVGVAVIALALAGFAVARVGRSEAATLHAAAQVEPAVAAPTIPEPQSTPATPATVTQDDAAPAPAALEPAPKVDPRRAARVVASHKAMGSASGPASAPQMAAAAPKDNCKIPFTIDAAGAKHFKAECF